MPSFGGVGKEAITFVLSGDASGLIKTFGDVEKAADKSLGKTENSIEKLSATLTKVGAVSIGVGLSTAMGLVSFIKDTEEAEAASNKLATAVKGMGSAIDTKAIKTLAKELQQVSSATDEQIVAAARWGAVFGLTTDQLEELLRAAVDLSAQTGKSVDETTKALARAASGGSTKALQKMGLDFNDAALEADAFSATVAAAMDFAGGAAAKGADTFSGQMDRIGKNWDDIKEQIGAGANEVFEPLAGAVADLSQSLAEANPELLQTVGHFTALGSIGATGFGGLATFAGQVVNIKDAASGLGIKLKDVEGGFTKLGKAAAVAGGAMAVFAAADVTFAAINAASTTGNLADALNDFTAKSKDAGRSGKDLANDFGQLAREQAKTLEFSDLWTGFGARIESSFDGVAVSIEDTQEALDSLSPDAAARALDSLQAVTDSLEKGSDQRKTNQEFIDKNRKSLKLEAEAADAMAEATGGLTKAEQDAADALKEWDAALQPMGGALYLAAAAADQAAAASKGFADAAEAFDSDEMITSAVALGGAFQTLGESVFDLPKSFDENAAALGLYTDEQNKALGALTSWGDAAKTQIGTLIESGAASDVVKAKTAGYRDALTKVMTQAGFTTEQIEEYQRILGLTDPQVETELKLSGDAEAKWKLQLYHNDLVTMTEDQQTWIRTLIDQGKYTEAWNALNTFKKGVDAPVRFVYQAGNVTGSADSIDRAARTAAPTATASKTTAPATTINITMPPGTPTSRTLAEIRRYRRTGGDMGGLLDTLSAVR